MINLVLAVCCSAAISLLMRISESRRQSSAAMFIWNYVVCTVLGLLYARGAAWESPAGGMPFTLGLGAVSGILYLASFLLLQRNVSRNGVVLASAFMKLGVLVPVLISVAVFREKPSMLQAAGLILAAASIVVFHLDRKNMTAAGSLGLLGLLLLVSGVSDSMINIYDKAGNPELSDIFLVCIFFSALICSLILFFVRKEKMGRWDVLFGLIIGLPNYFSSRFLLAALDDIPAVAAYPVYSVATILLVSLIGVAVFRERLSRQRWIGMAMAVAAVALLQ